MPDAERDPPASKRNPVGDAARSRFEVMRAFGQLGTLGLSFVIAIAMGVALGLWLDRLTGWRPVFFLIFFVLGFAAAVMNVYRTISRMK
jgi:F0F1-type ATP synthase assembly protein I